MLAVDSSLAGSQVGCPTCQGVVTIPLLDPPPSQPYAPPPSDTPISLNCPLCAGLFQVLSSSQGQQVSCPHCAGVIQVPFFEAPPGMASGAPPPFEPPAYEPPPSFAPPSFGVPPSNPGHLNAPPEPTWSPKPLFPSNPAPAAPSSPPQFRVEPPASNRPVPLSDPRVAGGGFSGANRPIPVTPPMTPPAPPAPLPSFETVAKKEPARTRRAETVAILPTEDGSAVALHDPVKTVGKPGQEIELRQLTPEEKAKRRVTRNIVMVTGSLLLLTIVMIVLINLR